MVGRPVVTPEVFRDRDAPPSDGVCLWTIDMPARQPNCPYRVAADFDRLLVATASDGLDAAVRAAVPSDGRVFSVDGGCRG